MQIELLQKYLFIPLDIFKKSKHNRNISDRRDAWLTLFTSDDPEEIIEIIEEYPEFRAVYEEGYEICLNMEKVMEMFSKELYELDRNTVQYMIDEMQDTIDAQKDELDKQQGTIDAQKEELNRKTQTIEELHRKNDEMYDQSIVSTINVLRSLNIPDEEIIPRVSEQHQLTVEQVKKYFEMIL